MITFTAMRLSSAVQRFIIGAALIALTACSAVRLGYDNGPSLALWWLDRYLDLDDAQEERARPLLREWFGWHRSTQLPGYAQWLAELRRQVVGAEQVCRLAETARDRLWPAVDRALPAGAELLPSITPAQWRYLEQRFAERQAELRKSHAQPLPEARRAAALERAVERAEQNYGEISEAQRRLLAAAVASSPMDPEAWLADRAARHRGFVQALQRAQQEADLARRTAALRAAVQAYAFGSSTPGGNAADERQARWQQHGCEWTARLHATTTPAQRQHLRERIGAWEEDLRALAGAAGA
jgi:hypothetical protein